MLLAFRAGLPSPVTSHCKYPHRDAPHRDVSSWSFQIQASWEFRSTITQLMHLYFHLVILKRFCWIFPIFFPSYSLPMLQKHASGENQFWESDSLPTKRKYIYIKISSQVRQDVDKLFTPSSFPLLTSPKANISLPFSPYITWGPVHIWAFPRRRRENDVLSHLHPFLTTQNTTFYPNQIYEGNISSWILDIEVVVLTSKLSHEILENAS